MSRHTLARIMARDLRLHAWRIAGLIALVGMVVATVAGRTRARETIVGTEQAVVRRLAGADLEILCAPGHVETLQEAAAAAGVAQAEVRRLAPGVLRVATRRPLPCIVRVLPESGPPSLQRLELVAGRMPRPDEEAAVVDRALVPLRDLALGDTIELTVGQWSKRLPVVGVTLSAEFPVAPIHPRYILPLRGTLGSVAISAAAAADHEQAHRATSILMRLAPGQSEDVVREAVTQHGVAVTRCTPVVEQSGRLFMQRLVANFDVFTPVVVVGLGLAGAVLAFLLLGRLVRQERRRVGMLAVLGYEPRPVARSFLVLAVPPAALGTLLGLWAHGAAAAALVRGTTTNLGFYPMRDAGVSADVLWAGVACFAALLLAVYVPAVALTRTPPSRALKPGRFELSRVWRGPVAHLAAWGRRHVPVPAWLTLGVTQALRRRRETIGAVLGLGIAFALLIGYLTVHLAHRHEIPAAVQHWSRDATVHFDAPVGADVLEATRAAAGGTVEPFLARDVFLVQDGRPRARRLLGMESAGLGADLPRAAGRAFASPDADEALVDRFMAMRDGIRVGDELTLLPHLSAPETTAVTVVGIVEGISFGRVVVPLDTARALYGLPEASNGAHVRSPLPGESLEARLWGVEHVEGVFGTQRIVSDLDAVLEGRLHVIRLGVLTVIGYALIFLAIVASLDASDRAPQVALLTSMGWRNRALFALLASEVLTRGLLGLGLGLLAAPFLARHFARKIAEVNGYFIETPMPWGVVALVCLAACLAFLVAALPAWWTARRQPLARMVGLLARE